MKNSFKEIILFGLAIFFICTMVGSTSDALKENKNSKCIASGCSSERTSGSSYCWRHSPTRSSYSSSYNKKSSTSTKKNTYNSNGSSSSSKKSYSSHSSYDAGYDSVYDDDDYDWDRYQRDSDYADGVDDAMDDLDW